MSVLIYSLPMFGKRGPGGWGNLRTRDPGKWHAKRGNFRRDVGPTRGIVWQPRKGFKGKSFEKQGQNGLLPSKIRKTYKYPLIFSLFKLSSSLLHVIFPAPPQNISASIEGLQSLIKVDLSDGNSN